MLLSNAALKNRTTVFVLVILIVFGGAFSYVTLPREAAPDVKTPYILVTTSYEGVSPEDIEQQITNEIEQELMGMSGVKEITSSSEEGLSQIRVEFEPDVDIEDALRRTKDKVDLAEADLPDDIQRKEPVVSEINIAEFPIMTINISGEVSPVVLKAVADRLEDEIKTVSGVLDVDVLGALEREIRIEVDPDRMAAYGLTLAEILAVIPSEHLNISAGGLETPGMKFNIRVPAEFKDPERINNIQVGLRNGKPIYLTDIARVRDTFKDREGYARLDGTQSISVAVKKRVGANIVDIANNVKAILAEFRKQAPATVQFKLTDDRSKDIHKMIQDLENNVISGLVLVVLVLVLFMGLRTSIIVGLAIPLSMLMSFAVLQMLGFTLNMVVLFSLILALGMLVDNAIVIVENIFRHMQMGYGRLEAAMKGTGQVAWPVITSTATTVAAFTPLLFWPGIMGDFMKYLPITVIITLICSLFVALIINPVITSIFAGKAAMRKKDHEGFFIRGYRRLLTMALNHRATTITLAVLLLILSVVTYAKFNNGMELFPQSDPQRSIVNLRGPQGMNIRDVNRIAKTVEKRIEKYTNDPNGNQIIDHVVTNVGSGSGTVLFGGQAGPHMANLTVLFVDYNDRKSLSEDTVAAIRRELGDDIPGMEVKVEREHHGPPTGSAVTVRFIGRDIKELERVSKAAKEKIKDVPGLVNLRSDLEAAKPELRFIVDRERATLLGLNAQIIGRFLRTANFGAKVGTYREFKDDYDITVRLPEVDRSSIDDLKRLRVPNKEGKAVPLSSLGEFVYAPGLGTIKRIDQQRVVTLTADAEGRLGNEVLEDVMKRLKSFEMPSGYKLKYAGEREKQDEAMTFLMGAFGMALLIIVGILVTQFNTLSAPLIIMTTVLLSLIGVFAGLLIFHMPFGVVMTGVGVISLAGVVVNNAIVLLDYTRQLQKAGMELVPAAIRAGVTRLRPVLLTAVTTILGLVPMATGWSFDFHTMEFTTRSEMSQWWSSMAIVVIFGLAFATLLTLVVVPSLYVSIYRIAAKFGLGGLQRDEDTVLSADELEDF